MKTLTKHLIAVGMISSLIFSSVAEADSKKHHKHRSNPPVSFGITFGNPGYYGPGYYRPYRPSAYGCRNFCWNNGGRWSGQYSWRYGRYHCRCYYRSSGSVFFGIGF